VIIANAVTAILASVVLLLKLKSVIYN
jgi:hypothetical protein